MYQTFFSRRDSNHDRSDVTNRYGSVLNHCGWSSLGDCTLSTTVLCRRAFCAPAATAPGPRAA